MLRFGLCCIFRNEPIRFRRTTAKHLLKFARAEQLRLLAEVCRHNAEALQAALHFCRDKGIKAFRINSQILPLKTHPQVGYRLGDLPGGGGIVKRFEACGRFCRNNDLRTSFHPDQFILLSSPRPEVIVRSKADLSYQAEVAEWVGADVINIHAGGAYDDKGTTLQRLCAEIETLPDAVRWRLTLENDDRVYTPADLLPVCRRLGIPLVYDVHHHRCLPDGVPIDTTTARALATWNREPLCHVSSPLHGWEGRDRRPHHDFVDPRDVPEHWLNLDMTVEVEAKAKELAVLKLMRDLAPGRRSGTAPP